ncbi:hypothetical protein E2C01_072616 [Portunus trituberculatus]|uniref:Uncharacterized protein n=1 Tax=Portunus trituberculatus TaxID=210409 RepID=A0A5B7I8B8_PORTR|nr:hypothetical protein [Portunus trituberculatus]
MLHEWRFFSAFYNHHQYNHHCQSPLPPLTTTTKQNTSAVSRAPPSSFTSVVLLLYGGSFSLDKGGEKKTNSSVNSPSHSLRGREPGTASALSGEHEAVWILQKLPAGDPSLKYCLRVALTSARPQRYEPFRVYIRELGG